MLSAPVGIFYSTESTEGVLGQGDELRLNNLRLSPWRVSIPDCDNCLVTTGVDDRPSGASHQLSLSRDDQIYWAFINGKTTAYRTDIGRFSFVDDQLYLQNDPDRAAITLNDTVTIGDCRYQLLWLQKPTAVALGISNDQPVVHYQVLYSCT
jgi:hypothetical protein